MSDKKEDAKSNRIETTAGDNATNVANGQNIQQTYINVTNNSGQVAEKITNTFVANARRRVRVGSALLLQAYHGTQFAFHRYSEDPETNAFANDLSACLTEAGW